MLSEPGVDGVGGVIIKLVNKLITDAYLDGASDIHIEPRPGNVFFGHSSRQAGWAHTRLSVMIDNGII